MKIDLLGSHNFETVKLSTSFKKILELWAIFKQISGPHSQWYILQQLNLIWFEVLQ